MRFKVPAVDHGQLGGVTADQHHAQLHAAAHIVGAGDVLGPRAAGLFTDDINTTALTVSNSAAESVLATFTIPANFVGDIDGMQLSAYGFFTNNTGAAQTVRLRVRHGGLAGNIIFDTLARSYATNAIDRMWELDAWWWKLTGVNTVREKALWVISVAGATPQLQFEVLVDAVNRTLLDPTVQQDLVITGLLGAANVNLGINFTGGILMIARGI